MSDEAVHHHSALANRLDPRVHDSATSNDPTSDSVTPTASAGSDDEPKGEDPNIVKSDSKKMTGTAAPGSHSALFGLTPDGKKTTDVDYSGGGPNVQPAHSKKSTTGGDDGDGETSKADKVNEAVTKASVSDKSGGSTSGPSSGDGPSASESASTSSPSAGDEPIGGSTKSDSSSGGPKPGDALPTSGDAAAHHHSSGSKPGDPLTGDDAGSSGGVADSTSSPSDAPPSGSVAEQMNDPRVNESQRVGTSDTGKPGTGSSSDPAAESGDADAATGTGIIDTVKSALGFK